MIEALVTLLVLFTPGVAFVAFGASLLKRSERTYSKLAAGGEVVPAWVRRVTRLASGLFLFHGIGLTVFGIFLAWCLVVPQ